MVGWSIYLPTGEMCVGPPPVVTSNYKSWRHDLRKGLAGGRGAVVFGASATTWET